MALSTYKMCLLEVNTQADTRRRSNVDLMLGQRRRQWANIKSTLDRRIVSAGTEQVPWENSTISFTPKKREFNPEKEVLFLVHHNALFA